MISLMKFAPFLSKLNVLEIGGLLKNVITVVIFLCRISLNRKIFTNLSGISNSSTYAYLYMNMFVYIWENSTYTYTLLLYTFNNISVDACFEAGSHCLKTSVE